MAVSLKMFKEGLTEVGQVAKKATFKPRKNGPQLGNLYTSHGVRNWVPAAIVAGGIGYGISLGKHDDRVYHGDGANNVSFGEAMMTRRPGPPSSYSGESPMMLSDGLQAPGMKADDLGTDGSMVFGMHNSKQGGYV